MLDNQVTRWPGGQTNVLDNDVFANLKVNDRSRNHEFFEDFDRYTAAQWVVGGVGTPVAPALVAGDGGILSVANSAASGDNNWAQQAATAWTLTAGKKLFFRARAQVDSALNSAMAFGLQVAVAANNFLTPADGLFIRKPAADTNVYLVHRVGGVETLSVALGVIADATQFEVSFAYDGQGNIIASLNGQVKASITPAALTAVALKVTLGVQNGTAAARTGLVDQLWSLKER